MPITKFSKISIQSYSEDKFCPKLVELSTSVEHNAPYSEFVNSIFYAHPNKIRQKYSSYTNQVQIPINTLADEHPEDLDIRCPAVGNGCPVRDMVAYRRRPNTERKQCVFA